MSTVVVEETALPSSVAALADLDEELSFLLGTAQITADTFTLSTETCTTSIWSNYSDCCPTKTLSGAVCCGSPAP